MSETQTQPAQTTSGWAPLRHRLFRDRWIASIVSNIGGWMQDTAGTWLMTALTRSPLLIALMQTAASLPVLMLGFAAGATADMFDRRRLLIFWQTWMLVAVLILSALTLLGIVSPWSLLTLTFLLNIGAAMTNPAWQAIVPELVPRQELPDAIAMNSAGYNLARAVGPALGGLMVAAFTSTTAGAGWVFFVNAISFVAVIWVLYAWHRTPLFKSALPGERMLGSMRTGLRYVRYAPALQAVLIRAFVFTFFVSAVWALLAVVAQQHLHQGAVGYGILNGCLGVGAVVGAICLPTVRNKLSADQIVAICTVVAAINLFILAFARNTPLIIFGLLAGGFAWTSTTSTFNVAVQLSIPAWVQARALGIYQTIFQGGMALGSVAWGFTAEHISTPRALMFSAIGLLITIPLTRGLHLLRGKPADLRPFTLSRPTPQLVIEPSYDDGPVFVTVEYQVHKENRDPFVESIHKLRDVRMRNGAIRWGVYQDGSNPERFVETFVVDSWLEFLRSRERMTANDRAIRDGVLLYYEGDAPPPISYMLYAREKA
ncbi:MAG: MFS transporter [Acidobacteriaceae bacterium]|nr:MFS transporter [Acidobacteriaceae bacterium]